MLELKYTKILILKNLHLKNMHVSVLSYKTGRKKFVICLHHHPDLQAGRERSQPHRLDGYIAPRYLHCTDTHDKSHLTNLIIAESQRGNWLEIILMLL